MMLFRRNLFRVRHSAFPSAAIWLGRLAISVTLVALLAPLNSNAQPTPGGTITTKPLSANAPGGTITTQPLSANAPGGTITTPPLSANAPGGTITTQPLSANAPKS